VVGWCWQREKNDWQEPRKFGCLLVWTIFIFVVPRQFPQDIGEWPENACKKRGFCPFIEMSHLQQREDLNK